VFGLKIFCKKVVVRLAYAGVSNVRANIVCVRIVEDSEVFPVAASSFGFPSLTTPSSVESVFEEIGFVLDFEAMDFVEAIRPRPR